VSSCREYDLCPRRYRFAYVDRLQQDRPAPDGWRYGTVVHSALEAAYRARADGAPGPTIEEAAVVALHEAWDREQLPADDADWRDRAEGLVRRTLSADLLHAHDILGVERRFSAPFDTTTAFAGQADLVLRRDDHTIEIVDHKVTRNVVERRTLRHDLQLNLYGWLAKNEWPWARRIIATHHYPPAATTTTVELTDMTMDIAMRQLVATARRAAADTEYRPTPGAHCSHCSWAPRCPAAMNPDSYPRATSLPTR
jgi:RecB family exonuclease